MSDSTVVPFRKNGRYTDIRVGIREVLNKVPNAKSGIIVVFDDADDMHFIHVCKASQMAYAAACLLKDAVEDDV